MDEILEFRVFLRPRPGTGRRRGRKWKAQGLRHNYLIPCIITNYKKIYFFGEKCKVGTVFAYIVVSVGKPKTGRRVSKKTSTPSAPKGSGWVIFAPDKQSRGDMV
jgi:hypothetical protein